MIEINKRIKKFKTRVTESKWTKFFVLASILQLCCVVFLETRVLLRNYDFKESVTDRYNFHLGNGDNCNLKPSIDRMSLIAQENIIFMIFQVFQLWFCLNAIYNQNIMQIITIAIINFICGLFGIVQIFEISKWATDLDKTCEGESALIDKNFVKFDVPLVICLILFATIIAFLSFRLYQQFGWNIYKKIGADIKIQKIYKTMLIFVMYLKLDLFFVLVTAIEVFLSFSVDTSGSSYTFTLPNKLYYFHLGITIMILFLEILAYRSLRLESKIGMVSYLVLSLFTVVDFIILLKFATDKISQSWYFFIVIVVVAIILSLLTWVWTLFVLMNFDQGLDKYLNKTKDQDIDLEGVTQTRPKRFTIED
ncbi:hypothetical protein Glove_216g132 [Diversispora epigaea]|uniref:Transmembrane protein n=1 Tax=Diversispora epigaea TaxID=1348612 RepID=A0A397IQ52_9GLOM|nr:hypothetical protein Glove_216g132 [Diversispora epigaea]